MTATAVARILTPWLPRRIDIEYRPGTEDDAVLDEIFDGDVYRFHDEPVRHALTHGDYSLDAGGHIGCWTIAALACGAASVLTIEPEDANFELLTRNLERNGYPTEHAVHAAVGLPETSRRVVMDKTGPSARSRHTDSDLDGVPVYGFEDLIDTGTLGILKCDVEGAEYDWFATARPEHLTRIDRIFMEWHRPTNPIYREPRPTELAAGDWYGALLERLAWTHSVSVFGRPDTGGMLYAHPND